MKSKSLIAIAGLAAAAFAVPAGAQMRTPTLSSAYIGGNIGQSKTHIDCDAGLTCDDKDTSFKLFAGYQFNRNFAAEFGYTDLGKAKVSGPGGTDEFKATAWELSAIGAWPIVDQFSIFGRLGGYYGEGKLSGPDHGNKKTTNLTWGFGAQYDFNRNLGVRAEWQRFTKVKFHNDINGADADGDVDSLSVGILWRFQ
jgi:OOP family OmpA-OmpF porin